MVRKKKGFNIFYFRYLKCIITMLEGVTILNIFRGDVNEKKC